MSFQGRIEKGLVVLERPVPLPDGTPVLVEPMTTEVNSFWQSRALDELATQQGVAWPATDELLGGWPAEECNDDFEVTMRSWRQSELETRP